MIFVEKLAFAQKNDYFIKDKIVGSRIPSASKIPPNPLFKSIPENFYFLNLGIICKQEWKIEKATKIPFRIRIGSLQQCDWLEGKKYSAP